MADRVLILDDDEDLREVLAELFRGTLGIDCVGAASMDELLEQRDRALSCKLAVLDVNLGPQSPSGFQAYSWLRSQGFAGRIVFLTGHAATRADVQEARLQWRSEGSREKPRCHGKRSPRSLREDSTVTSTHRLELQRAWRTCLFAALLNAFGVPLDWPIGRQVPGMPWWPYAFSVTIGALLAAFLLGARRRVHSVRVISVLFVVNAVATLVVLWVAGEHYATAQRTWVPFQPNKLGGDDRRLAFAPDIWAGLLSIAGYTGAAVLQLLHVRPPAVRERLPLGEPWAMLAFGAFSVVLLAYRARQFALRARARAGAPRQRVASSGWRACSTRGPGPGKLADPDSRSPLRRSFARTTRSFEREARLIARFPGA